VSLDATPLLGERAGVAAFCSGALPSLVARSDLAVHAFAMTWRRRGELATVLPTGVASTQRVMPAWPLQQLWRRSSFPPAEWFTGAFDVIHGTNYLVPPTRSGARVVTVQDLTVVRFPELCQSGSLIFDDLVRRAVAQGAWVHTPSRFVADEVVSEFGAAPERVRVVHYGVPSHARLQPAADAVSLKESGKSFVGSGPLVTTRSRRYVLAVGTVEPRKDLPGLVRAFDEVAARHDDVLLVIAGGEGWGSAALDEALGRARFAARVVRTGYLADVELQRLLAGAAVLAYPSIYEGFGFPPLEAMAAGIPVVATAVGSIPEVVGDAAILVAPSDSEALATALDRVLDRDDVRTELVERGLARAGQFSWDECAAGLAALYHEASSSSV
jgi:glycosyltransferase involved in cell wall biosynthesis